MDVQAGDEDIAAADALTATFDRDHVTGSGVTVRTVAGVHEPGAGIGDMPDARTGLFSLGVLLY